MLLYLKPDLLAEVQGANSNTEPPWPFVGALLGRDEMAKG
jgi:hypothetical protein